MQFWWFCGVVAEFLISCWMKERWTGTNCSCTAVSKVVKEMQFWSVGLEKARYVTWVDLVLLFQCIGSESICCKENLGDQQNESAGRIQACLSVEVMQWSAEYVKDGLTIQLTNMAGDVVYTGKFKEDLDQMRFGKMEKRARYKAASSISLSYMRPLKLCGKGGQVLGRRLKVTPRKPRCLPSFASSTRRPMDCRNSYNMRCFRTMLTTQQLLRMVIRKSSMNLISATK